LRSWYKKYYWQQWCGNFVRGWAEGGITAGLIDFGVCGGNWLLDVPWKIYYPTKPVSKEIAQFARMYICELHKWSCRPMFDWKLDDFACRVSFGLSFTLSVFYLLFLFLVQWRCEHLGWGMKLGFFVWGWCFLWCIFSLAWWRTEPLTTSLHSNLLDLGPCHLGLSARSQGLLWSICYIHVDYWNTKFSPVNGIFFYTNTWPNHGLRYDPFWVSFSI